VPPFCPTAGTEPLPEAGQWLAAATAGAREVPVVIGTTRDEMNTFLNGKPGIAPLEANPWTGRALDALKAAITRFVFDKPSRRFADLLAARGGRVFTYRFDWTAPGSTLGACHCIELPFLLGDRDSWAGAPMLAGSDWDGLDELGRVLRGAWLSFTRTGTPESTLAWPPHSPRAQVGARWTAGGSHQAGTPSPAAR
jgi:para-nitrobenzyl esterase